MKKFIDQLAGVWLLVVFISLMGYMFKGLFELAGEHPAAIIAVICFVVTLLSLYRVSKRDLK